MPVARAADLTIDDNSPTINFDDNQDEDGNNAIAGWEIYAYGGATNVDTNNYFTITAYEGNADDSVIWLESRADNKTESSLRVYYDGNVSLAATHGLKTENDAQCDQQRRP